MTGAYFATGPCVFCGRVFTFDPERVPSIPVDERGNVTLSGVKHPLCADCMTKINEFREFMGAQPIHVLAGAYEPTEGFPP